MRYLQWRLGTTLERIAQLPTSQPRGVFLIAKSYQSCIAYRADSVSDNSTNSRTLTTSGAANGHAVHLDGWDADADGNCLAVLAAGADSLVELQVVTHHGDTGEHVRPVTDQGAALQR